MAETEQENQLSDTLPVDHTLMRQQQLQQQYKQINERIMELRQQKTLVADMITDATIQAAEMRGAMREISTQQAEKG